NAHVAAGLNVLKLDHVSVIITDVERSRRFYGELLGLKEIARPRTFDFVVVWFDLGDHHLHLLLKPQPDTASPRHFALRVAAAAGTWPRGGGDYGDEAHLIPVSRLARVGRMRNRKSR